VIGRVVFVALQLGRVALSCVAELHSFERALEECRGRRRCFKEASGGETPGAPHCRLDSISVQGEVGCAGHDLKWSGCESSEGEKDPRPIQQVFGLEAGILAN